MNVRRLIRLDGTITPIDADAVDVFGDEGTAAGDPFPVKYWHEEIHRDELTANADTQIETDKLYLLPEVTVSGSDRFTDQDGITFEIVGPPWPAHNPRTRKLEYIAATIRKVA